MNIRLYLYDTDSCNIYSKRREFVFFLERELPEYHHIFSFSSVMTDFFKQTRGLPATYAPYGAEKIAMPAPTEQQHHVLFVGSADLRRVFVLEHIREQVSIFGSRWERNFPLMSDALKSRIMGNAAWGGELHQLFANSKIILNITRTQFYGAETGINLRIFEALAAGCFLLTDYCDEVADLFRVGYELETFKSSKELKEKVDYYLANPAKRIEIANNGHQAFLERFIWTTRMRPVLEQMGALSD